MKKQLHRGKKWLLFPSAGTSSVKMVALLLHTNEETASGGSNGGGLISV